MENNPPSLAPVQRVVGRTFNERLASIYEDRMPFFELERRMYPHESYPRYWKYSINGGPPGGRMALVAALARRGIHVFTDNVGRRICHGRLPNPERSPAPGPTTT